jgi:hypothetical protein
MPGPIKTLGHGISESRMKALKRQRGLVRVPDPDYPEEDSLFLASVPPGPHAPNKAEARLLRSICAKTGLTPGQVRERKRYRQVLAQAARSSTLAKPGAVSREWKLFLARVRGRTQAAPWTAEYKAAFQAVWEATASYSGLRQTSGWTTAEQAYAWLLQSKGYAASRASSQAEPSR